MARNDDRRTGGDTGRIVCAEDAPVARVRVTDPRWPHGEQVVEAESVEALSQWDPTCWHPAG